jgi:hypothetical protein
MSILMLNTGLVNFPVFQLLRNDFVQALQGAARTTSLSTDDMGDYFNMTLASKMPLDQVADDATVLVPLFNIENGATWPPAPLCTPGSWVTLASNGVRTVRCILERGGIPAVSNWNSH